MAIETEFLRLTAAFEAMRDALNGLALTVIEDRPAEGEVLLVDRLGALVEDLRGWAAEGSAAAMQGREAVANPVNGYQACRALGRANERFIRMEWRFFDDAISHETIGELMHFGRHRGSEWLGWSRTVQNAMQSCRGPLRELDGMLLQTWLELSERLCSRSVSLHSTNMWQQTSGLPSNSFAPNYTAHEPGTADESCRQSYGASPNSNQIAGG
jgi:hypothetical protein